jgi:hypothetical protein
MGNRHEQVLVIERLFIFICIFFASNKLLGVSTLVNNSLSPLKFSWIAGPPTDISTNLFSKRRSSLFDVPFFV